MHWSFFNLHNTNFYIHNSVFVLCSLPYYIAAFKKREIDVFSWRADLLGLILLIQTQSSIYHLQFIIKHKNIVPCNEFGRLVQQGGWIPCGKYRHVS